MFRYNDRINFLKRKTNQFLKSAGCYGTRRKSDSIKRNGGYVASGKTAIQR